MQLRSSRLERLALRVGRRLRMMRVSATDQIAQWAAFGERRAYLFERDHNRCRACKRRVYFETTSALALGSVYRFPGGDVLVCAFCDADLRKGTLEVDGDAEVALAFRRFDQFGQVRDAWGSPRPTTKGAA